MIVNHIGQYIGNYRIVRLLGTGGQASVYLGEHHYLKRPAAIKMLRIESVQQDEKTRKIGEDRNFPTFVVN